MKNWILGLAVLAVACNNAPSQEHEGHDHSAMEEAAAANTQVVPTEGARVFFLNLMDGDTVSSPVKVLMGVEGMTVEPAGELKEGTGHHHILLGGAQVAQGETVPADSTHIHFGKGQTETELALPAGEQTISLQFANGLHQSYGPQMSQTIRVFVK